MFEGKLKQGVVLKKMLDAIKDLVSEATWDCNSGGMTLQAMDTSHVSLVAVQLNPSAFIKYRCDRSVTLSMNLAGLSKVLKASSNDDTVTLKAQDDTDKMTLLFEAKSENEIAEYELKLMNLDSEYLGIPETQYSVNITMPAHKFQRVVRDLGAIGETITISCAKDGVRFAVAGDVGTGNIKLSQNASQDKKEEKVTIKMSEPICLSFAAKYLNHFAKATPLATQVSLSLSPDVPLVVEYKVELGDEEDNVDDVGYIRYYLAPKIDESEE